MNPPAASRPGSILRSAWRPWVGCLLLVAAIAFVYGQLFYADFINLDDYDYVKFNAHLAQGFSWANIKWAFTPGYASNWHPLTWFSHIIDYKLFGLDPSWHHLVNLGFHAANSVVLFLLLRSLTQRDWESLLVAALFALHPLHVESVAWISERKDVLCTFFILLTCCGYTGYVHRAIGKTGRAGWWYWGSVMLFTLALMAKPMAVTLPFVLLLLDFWPLNRWRTSKSQNPRWPLTHLVIEKTPFFVLTVATCVLTMKAQEHAMMSLDAEPLWVRFANAVLAYGTYLRKTIWPTDLAVIYPLAWPEIKWVLCSTVTLLVISITVVWQRYRRPYLIVGWLWFLGILVPTIGIIQVGNQRLADRFTYVPLVGLFIAIVFWLSDTLSRRWLRRYVWGAGIFIIVCFGYCSHDVCGYWRNSLSLFDYGLSQTAPNWVLYSGLGGIIDNLQNQNLSGGAERYFKSALVMQPDNAELCRNYGNFFVRRGKYVDALGYYDRALALRPTDTESYLQKANVLAILGRRSEAEYAYLQTLQTDPGNVIAEVNLAGLYAIQNRFEQAIARYENVVRSVPTYTQAQHLYGVTLARMGKMDEAVSHIRSAIKYSAVADPVVLNDLAWLVAAVQSSSVHDPLEAVRLAKKACELTKYSDIATLDTLAVAYAEAGQFSDAISVAEKTIELAKKKERTGVAAEMERRKALYVEHRPYRPAVIVEEKPINALLDLTPRK